MVDITSLSCPRSSFGLAIRAIGLPEGWVEYSSPVVPIAQFPANLQKPRVIWSVTQWCNQAYLQFLDLACSLNERGIPGPASQFFEAMEKDVLMES
jgi:hypothetical protein